MTVYGNHSFEFLYNLPTGRRDFLFDDFMEMKEEEMRQVEEAKAGGKGKQQLPQRPRETVPPGSTPSAATKTVNLT